MSVLNILGIFLHFIYDDFDNFPWLVKYTIVTISYYI